MNQTEQDAIIRQMQKRCRKLVRGTSRVYETIYARGIALSQLEQFISGIAGYVQDFSTAMRSLPEPIGWLKFDELELALIRLVWAEDALRYLQTGLAPRTTPLIAQAYRNIRHAEPLDGVTAEQVTSEVVRLLRSLSACYESSVTSATKYRWSSFPEHQLDIMAHCLDRFTEATEQISAPSKRCVA